jgi:hypothetical protein
MGQLRKRGRIWWIRYYRNGQRIEESTVFKTYDEARDLLKKREGAVADGVPITAMSTRLTFDDAAKDVLNDHTINGKRSKDCVERLIDLHLTRFSVAGGSTASQRQTSEPLPRHVLKPAPRQGRSTASSRSCVVRSG